MQKADPLIRTKLHLPFTRPGIVSRPRLQEQVTQGLRCPLTLITAPAGFGKTTLAAACLAECGMPVAWLSLDKNDNQPGRFLRYIVAALQEVDPAIGQEAAQLMQAAQPALPEVVLTSLVNDLDAAGRGMVLTLDDYQLISSQAVHEQVTFLLEHCPLSFHLVIASRSDPPLPVSRLRSRGLMVELRAADLRFTEPEAALFLNDVMGLHLDEEAVAALAGRTEGWIAGLQMAALSMRDRKDVRGFIEGFSGTNRYILDYLLEEVLASQPPEIQQFLLHTAILERLTAALCEAITEISERGKERSNEPAPDYLDARAILDYLDRANLFLVPLDDERTWYRYHHLFADLLRLRLQQAQPELIPVLHIRAAGWLEQRGLINEAVHHLFAAGEIEQAADLIERYGPRRLAEGDPSVLQLAGNLPPEMVLARPVIALYQAWLLIMQARIPQAYPLLIALSQDAGQSWIRTFALTALAFLARPSDVQGLALLPDYSLLDEIPDEEVLLRNAADLLYGMALARRGDYDRAVEVSLSCIQREKTQHGAQAIPSVAPFLSRLYLIHGRLHAAAALCHEFLDPLNARGNRFIYSSGSMKIDLGEVLYEWNHLDEAEQLIRDGLLANEPWRNIMTDGFGLGALARVLMAKGDHAEALQAAEKLESRLLEHAQPREFDEDLRTLRARAQLAGGDVHSPSRWAEQVLLSEDFAQHQELYSLTLGRIRLAQGRHAEVERLLDGFVPPFSAGSQVRRQLEANLLLSAALAGQQRLAEAFSLIDASLALAEPEGYLSVFLSIGDPVRELLAAYLRSAVPAQKTHAQSILQVYGHTDGIPQAGLIEPLSARELEVLELIAQGKTNQEIAQKLIVSPGTVKAHTASIYRKLDAANRTEAVARARQLGILG